MQRQEKWMYLQATFVGLLIITISSIPFHRTRQMRTIFLVQNDDNHFENAKHAAKQQRTNRWASLVAINSLVVIEINVKNHIEHPDDARKRHNETETRRIVFFLLIAVRFNRIHCIHFVIVMKTTKRTNDKKLTKRRNYIW